MTAKGRPPTGELPVDPARKPDEGAAVSQADSLSDPDVVTDSDGSGAAGGASGGSDGGSGMPGHPDATR